MIEAARAVPYPDLVPARLRVASCRPSPALGDATARAGLAAQAPQRHVHAHRRASAPSTTARSPRTATATTAAALLRRLDDDGHAGQQPRRLQARLDPRHLEGRRADARGAPGGRDQQPGQRVRARGQDARRRAPALDDQPAITNPSVTSIIFCAVTTSQPLDREVAARQRRGRHRRRGRQHLAVHLGIPEGQPGHIVDGTYLVSAKAYDQYGQAGTGKTLTMVLNRYAPARAERLRRRPQRALGRDFVEFEWAPNPERDITGYRVYRMRGAARHRARRLVCSTVVDDANPTSCVATGQPAGEPAATTCRAGARARHAGRGVERAPSSSTLVQSPRRPPDAPTGGHARRDDRPAATISCTGTRRADPDGTSRFYRDLPRRQVRLDRRATTAPTPGAAVALHRRATTPGRRTATG